MRLENCYFISLWNQKVGFTEVNIWLVNETSAEAELTVLIIDKMHIHKFFLPKIF